MALQDDEEHEVMWLVEDEGPGGEQGDAQEQPLSPEARAAELEEELQRVRKELGDVRRELAAKTVQLMRKEQTAAQDKANEAASAAQQHQQQQQQQGISEMERQLQLLAGQVHQLEAMLAQREEELDEVKKLAASQKRALREAAALQGEREAVERAAAEASRAVAGQAVEEELERLHAELVATKTRSELELQGREEELRRLKRELAAVSSNHKQALAAQEAHLTEAWQAEMQRVQDGLNQRIGEYETEVARLRTQLEDSRTQADSTTLISELAMLNNQKVQVQREFEAFKDMATQTARKNREEVARLLEENANLHSKLANYKTAELIGAGATHLGRSGSSAAGYAGGPHSHHHHKVLDVMSDQPPPGVGAYSAYAYQAAHRAMEAYMPQVLARLETHQRGLLPFVIVGGVVLLIITIAVIRAAASAHSQHSGALCFLAKLGIRVGKGCGVPHALEQDPSKEIASLLDLPKRHHDVDVDTIAEVLPAADPTAAPADAAAPAADGPAAEGDGGTAAAEGAAQGRGGEAAGGEEGGGAARVVEVGGDGGGEKQQEAAAAAAATRALRQRRRQLFGIVGGQGAARAA